MLAVFVDDREYEKIIDCPSREHVVVLKQMSKDKNAAKCIMNYWLIDQAWMTRCLNQAGALAGAREGKGRDRARATSEAVWGKQDEMLEPPSKKQRKAQVRRAIRYTLQDIILACCLGS